MILRKTRYDNYPYYTRFNRCCFGQSKVLYIDEEVKFLEPMNNIKILNTRDIIMDNIISILSVLVYGIIILILLGFTASLLSPFIVLNEQSLIADGLSHVAFAAIAVGLFFSDEPIYIAIPILILTSILIKWISKVSKVGGDVSLGMVSSVGLSLGLILIKFTTTSVNLENLMTGNVWLRPVEDIYLSLGILVLVGAFILINYRKLLALTFDEDYARFMGFKVDLLGYILSALTALFVVVGIRSVGILLISSFLIFPTVIAQVYAKVLKICYLLEFQ